MIYIASKTRHQARWKALRASGVPIIPTWLNEPDPSPDPADLWLRCIREASECDALIVYIEPDDTLKGAFAEIGAALAHGRPVWVVAPPLGVATITFTPRPAYEGLSLFNHPLVQRAPTVEQALIDIAKWQDDAEAKARADGEVVGITVVNPRGLTRSTIARFDEGSIPPWGRHCKTTESSFPPHEEPLKATAGVKCIVCLDMLGDNGWVQYLGGSMTVKGKHDRCADKRCKCGRLFVPNESNLPGSAIYCCARCAWT